MADVEFNFPEPEEPCGYYNTDTFNKLDIVDKIGISTFHMNARSLQNKKDDIEIFLTSLKIQFDVLMFTETWYSAKALPVQFPSYTCLHIDRDNKPGGGVAIYHKSALQMTEIDKCSVSTADIECLAAQHRDTCFVVVYRPPPESSRNSVPILKACYHIFCIKTPK